MTTRFVTHDTMVIERDYAATPARVFAAWADPVAKKQWFISAGDDFDARDYELDFRVGGHERTAGDGGGHLWTYDARYDDIVDGARIVYSYFMLRDDVRISVSVTAVEFTADGDRTHLVLTEHGVYLDGEDKPELRFEGISLQLDALGALLTAEPS